jgi:hypothetical protein
MNWRMLNSLARLPEYWRISFFFAGWILSASMSLVVDVECFMNVGLFWLYITILARPFANRVEQFELQACGADSNCIFNIKSWNPLHFMAAPERHPHGTPPWGLTQHKLSFFPRAAPLDERTWDSSQKLGARNFWGLVATTLTPMKQQPINHFPPNFSSM